MKLCMDIEGIIVQLEIAGYSPDYDPINEWWCKTSFSFTSEPWLNYEKHDDELFLPSEVEELSVLLNKLLNGEIKEELSFECAEPDFTFVMHPEKGAIQTDWQVSFWHDGLTANYLSVTLDETETGYLRDYIDLVCGKIAKNDDRIQQMIKKGVLKV